MASNEESRESRDEEWFKFKGRSKVWEHFQVNKDKSKVQCKLCERTYVFCSSTANFWNHLAKEHGIKQKEEQSEASGSSSHQPTISACFMKATKESLRKVLARYAAKDRFSFRQIAESLDLREG